MVFVECGGNIDTSFPLSFVYFLEDMAQDNDNITLINVEQEMELFSNGFSPNGSSTCNMDNLKHVRVKQYIKKTDGACETVTTDISAYRGKNHKYSKFLANIIVLLSSIEHISYEKVSDILKLFLILISIEGEFMIFMQKMSKNSSIKILMKYKMILEMETCHSVA